MVKSRVGNTLVWRQIDEEDKRAASPRDLIRRYPRAGLGSRQKIPYNKTL
jgi:hypothetical protein